VIRIPDGALRLWRTLAGDPTAFQPASRRAVRDTRGFCPPGWVGVVRLGDAYAVERGGADDATVARLLALPDPADPEPLATVLAASERLGPAELAYPPAADHVRAQGQPGREIARAVGYVEVGRQLSVRPPGPAPAPTSGT